MSTEAEAAKKALQKKKINQRAGHRAHVNRIVKDAEVDLQADESSDVKIRLEGYKVTLSEKISVLSKLDDEIAEYLSEEEDFTSEFEKAGEYRETMQRLIRVINTKVELQLEKSPSAERSSMDQFDMSGSESSQFRKHSKLPKLTIPLFKGNPLEWQSWWEGFHASVHANNDISPITKFNYLRSFLQGPALAAISGLSLIEANYGDAVGILHDRFGNKQLLISSNTSKLLSLPTISSSEDIVKLRDLYNKMETSVRNLQSLDVEKEKYGSLLVSIVMTKLPNDITLIITRCMPHANEEWSIDEFLDVLKKEVDAREISAHMKGTKKTEKKNTESNDDDDVDDVQHLHYIHWEYV